MKTLVIYNKKAGGGKAASHIEEIKTAFIKYKIDFEIKFTEYVEHAIKLIREIDLEKYSAIVTVGGDGTFYESLNGYFQNTNKTNINFGVLPIGTGNSLSRDIYDKEMLLLQQVSLNSWVNLHTQ